MSLVGFRLESARVGNLTQLTKASIAKDQVVDSLPFAIKWSQPAFTEHSELMQRDDAIDSDKNLSRTFPDSHSRRVNEST